MRNNYLPTEKLTGPNGTRTGSNGVSCPVSSHIITATESVCVTAPV